MNSLYLGLVALAFVSAVIALPLLNRLAMGVGWVDASDARKVHEGTVPLTGGLTVAIAVIAAVVLASAIWPDARFGLMGPAQWTAWSDSGSWLQVGLVTGLVACFMVGFWDDRFPLRARHRFIVQIAACVCAVATGNVLAGLGTTFTPVPLGLALFAAPLTVVALAGLVNAYNIQGAGQGCSFVMPSFSFQRFQVFARQSQEATKGIEFHDWLLYAFTRYTGGRWYIDPHAGFDYRQHLGNSLGANVGVRGLLHRFRRLRSSWYRGQVVRIANVLLQVDSPYRADALAISRTFRGGAGLKARFQLATRLV